MIKDNQLYKILVIEDSEGDFVLFEEYIYDHFTNTEITNVTSFKEFKAVATTANDFDIIFLDLSLPDKSGIELVKASIALPNLTPIVVLTGYPDFNFALQSLSLGVSDYLLKEDLSSLTIYKCIVYNIERYKNIIKIKESEQRYLDLFHLSPNPLFVYDEETKKITNVNNTAIQIYQYSIEEFLEMKIDSLEVDINDTSNQNINIRSLETDYQLIYSNIKCHKKKSGEPLFVITKKNKYNNNAHNSIIFSIEDLTQEIFQILSIQQQNKKLREIAWTQSHIVRAPVARIMGLIDLLNYEPVTSDNQKQLIDMILSSSNELDEVIKDIVDKTKSIKDS